MVVHQCLILPDQYLKLLFEFRDPCIALLHSPNKGLGDCCIVQPRTSFGWGFVMDQIIVSTSVKDLSKLTTCLT